LDKGDEGESRDAAPVTPSVSSPPWLLRDTATPFLYRGNHASLLDSSICQKEPSASSLTKVRRGCRRILVKGPRKSGRSTLLLDWARTLAKLRCDETEPCAQCNFHPETCRCNYVDLILCRPASSPTVEDDEQRDLAELFPMGFANSAKDCSRRFSQREHWALRRVRVHWVHTKRQFLSVLLQMQGRPSMEQPWYGIFVDDLDKLAAMPAGAHFYSNDQYEEGRNLFQSHSSPTPHGQTQNTSIAPSPHQQTAVLSQLMALLVDTTRCMAKNRKHAKTGMAADRRISEAGHQDRSTNEQITKHPRFVLAVTVEQATNGAWQYSTWFRQLFPRQLDLEEAKSD